MMAFQSCSKSNPWLNTNFNLLASHGKWDLCCGLFSKMLNPAESLILPSSFPFYYFYLHSINIMLKNGSYQFFFFHNWALREMEYSAYFLTAYYFRMGWCGILNVYKVIFLELTVFLYSPFLTIHIIWGAKHSEMYIIIMCKLIYHWKVCTWHLISILPLLKVCYLIGLI